MLCALLTALVLSGPAAAQTRTPDSIAREASPDSATTESAERTSVTVAPPNGTFAGRVGRDFQTFFSRDETVLTVGLLGAGALAASPWDAEGARTASANWSDDAFRAGKLAGNFFTHLAAGGGTYLVGRVVGQSRLARLGEDVLRAQILSQAVAQAAKQVTHRSRPDGSNHHSLPSGHSATAFATATVMQRHFGWRAGIPAYAFAAYVGASRLQAHRHYLSDVLLGAGVGIAAGRSVTIGAGDRRFAIGVAPAPGGAAITVSPR
jgi:membrane-associated phospholipid phosphatase